MPGRPLATQSSEGSVDGRGDAAGGCDDTANGGGDTVDSGDGPTDWRGREVQPPAENASEAINAATRSILILFA
jgi:hypothetical protein